MSISFHWWPDFYIDVQAVVKIICIVDITYKVLVHTMAWFHVIYRYVYSEYKSIRPVEINQYDITMATDYDMTMGSDIARNVHCEITIGNDVARDIHCDVTMSNDIAMCTYYDIPDCFACFIYTLYLPSVIDCQCTIHIYVHGLYPLDLTINCICPWTRLMGSIRQHVIT